jgi:hypothetical protein
MTQITPDMVHNAVRYASRQPGDVNQHIARYLNAELMGRTPGPFGGSSALHIPTRQEIAAALATRHSRMIPPGNITWIDEIDLPHKGNRTGLYWPCFVAALICFGVALFAMWFGEEGIAAVFGFGTAASIILGWRSV